MQIDVNTINFQGIGKKGKNYGICRITIPPTMIPSEMMELLHKQQKELKELGERLSKENKDPSVIKKIKTQLKNKHKKVFALFMNLEKNSTILTFGVGESKTDFYNEDNQLQLIDDILNGVSSYFKKDVKFVLPSPSRKQPTAQKESIELLEEKNKDINFLNEIINKLGRLMIMNMIEFSDYKDSDNKDLGYNKYIKLNDNELEKFKELNNKLQADKDFMEYAFKIIQRLDKKE